MRYVNIIVLILSLSIVWGSITDGLILSMPFDGNSNDQIGWLPNDMYAYYPLRNSSGYNITQDAWGMQNGGCVAGSTCPAAGYEYVTFDGVNDLINLTDTTAFESVFAGDFSVHMKYNAISTSKYGMGISKRDSWSDSNIGWDIIIFQDRIFIKIDSTGSVIQLATGTEFPSNVWYDFMAVFNRTNNLTIYINGQKNASIDISAQQGSLSNNIDLVIGASLTNAVHYTYDSANGSIRDVAFWDRALTSSEISAIYNKSRNITYLGTAGYDFTKGNANDIFDAKNGISGNVIYNSSGAMFNGVNSSINITLPFSTNVTERTYITTLKVYNRPSENLNFVYGATSGDYTSRLLFGDTGGSFTFNCFNSTGSSTISLDGVNTTFGHRNEEMVIATGYNATHLFIYLNGVLDNSVARNGKVCSENEQTSIGTSYYAGRFNGTVKNFMIYDRALSSTEISTLYNTSKVQTLYKEAKPAIKTSYYNTLNLTAGYDFKLNKNATDISGNGKTGTCTNCPIYAGNGAMFDGVDDFIDAHYSTINNVSELTMHIRAKYINDSTTYGFVVHSATGENKNTTRGLFANTGYVSFSCFNSTGGELVLSTIGLDNHLFHDYDFIISESTVSLYIDGILNLSTSRNGFNCNQKNSLIIGSVSTDTFSGTISNVMIYNRSLSASEILELHNQYSSASNLFNENNKAMNFSNNGIIITSLNNISTSTGITVSSWVNVPTHQTGPREYLVAYENSSDGIFLRENIGILQFAASGDTQILYNISNLSGWHHYVGINNLTDSFLYIDNTLVNTSIITIGGKVDTKVSIGSYSDLSQSLNGIIYNTKLYTRALNSSEVYELYSTDYPVITSNITSYTQANGNFDVNSAYTTNKLLTCGMLSNDSSVSCSNATILSPSIYTCSIPAIISGNITFTPFCNFTSVFFYGSNKTLYLDTVVPLIQYSFGQNNSILLSTNLTGQFNFSDDSALFRWNVSVDSNPIGGAVNPGYNTYSYNLSLDPTTLKPGLHTLTIIAADGHTSEKLKKDYNVKMPLLSSDNIEFQYDEKTNAKITVEGGSMFDVFSTEKKTDRYTFKYEPSKVEKKVTFIVNSDAEIYIVDRPNTPYKKWLVVGDHWLDFYSAKKDYNPKYQRNKNNEIVVTIDNKDLDATLEFESTGDLNIVTYNFTFYSLNATINYASLIGEDEAQSITSFVNLTDTLLAFGDVNATFVYNNTAYTLSKTSDASGVTFTSQTFNTPLILTAMENITFNFNYSVIGNPNYVLYRNQTVGHIAVDNCSSGTTAKALNFSGVDEENLSSVNPMTTNINLEIITSSGNLREAGFAFSGGSSYAICIYPHTSTFNTNLKLEYGDGVLYSNRKYYAYNFNISNNTQYIPLYHLLNTHTSDVILTVYDKTTGNRISNALVKILRYYPQFSNGSSADYKLVESELTDVNGQAGAKMVLADVWYKFIVEYPVGTVRLDSDIEKILTTDKQIPISLSVAPLLAYNQFLDVSGVVSCTKSTQTCRFTWSDASNLAVSGTLSVYEDTGFAKNLVYTTTITSPAASIVYVIPGNTTNKKYIIEGWVNTNE